MSNLGAYQWMTTKAKKVGGPVNFLMLVGAAGAVCYKGGEMAVKQCIKTIKANKGAKPAKRSKEEKLHKVIFDGKSNEGLEFTIGDQFHVLETDGDSVLIKKVGDENNPYFVSAKLLRKISDYSD